MPVSEPCSQTVINYCLRNVSPETRALLRLSGFKVIEDFCLQRCGNCYDGPFLVVGGQLVTGDSHQTILEKLGRDLDPVGLKDQL